MKFRRKSAEADPAAEAEVPEGTTEARPSGPYDVDDLPADDPTPRMDLGSMLIAPIDGVEVRLQVEEDSDEVESVVLANEEGMVELRVFAAPRHGDLWSDVRQRIAADFAQRGGTADERPGPFGTELHCQITVQTQDGRTGTQPSRVIGVNGPRWMLRATMLGKPAMQPDDAAMWEGLVEQVVVRRGTHPMPVGEELALTLPTDAQLIEHPGT